MDNTTKKLLKGAVAGAAGVWVMDRLTWYMYRNEDPKAYKQEKKAQVDGKYAAHAAAEKMLGGLSKNLSDKQFYAAGKVIHYALGMLPGAMYAAYRHRLKGLSAGSGLLYGLGLFIVVDEVVAPLLGFTSGPKAYPWQAHARGLAGHLALGATTDASLKLLNKTLSQN